jgi:hypothetical protein
MKKHDGKKPEWKKSAATSQPAEIASSEQLQSIEARLAAVEKATAQTQSIATRLSALERQQAEILTLLRAAAKPDSQNTELARADHSYDYPTGDSKSEDEEDGDRD